MYNSLKNNTILRKVSLLKYRLKKVFKAKTRFREKWWAHPLMLLIIGGAIIDMLSLITRDSVVNISALIRIILLFTMFIVFARSPRSKEKTKSIQLLAVCGVFFVVRAFFVNYDSLFELAHQFARTWYFPLFLVMMLSTKMLDYKKIPGAILMSTSLYALIIVATAMLGLSLYTHDNATTQSGAVGWFYAGNEISIILAIGSILAIVFLSSKELSSKIYYLPFSILIAVPLVGTKVSLAGGVVAVIFSLVYRYLYGHKTGISLHRLLLCIAVFSISFVSAPALQDFAVRNVSASDGSGDNITRAIRSKVFSGRIYYLEQRSTDYKNGDIAQILFGRGDYANESKVRISEMDPFDILFANGIVGLVVYLFMVMPPMISALRCNNKKRMSEYSLCAMALRIGLIMAVVFSFIAGHILVAPAVSIMLVAIIYYLNIINKIDVQKGLLHE